MKNALNTLLQYLGLQVKEQSLDAKAAVADDLGRQALGLFEAAADGLEMAASFRRGLAKEYEDLYENAVRQADEASDAADESWIAAHKLDQQAAKVRETFGLAPEAVAA